MPSRAERVRIARQLRLWQLAAELTWIEIRLAQQRVRLRA